MSWHPWLIFTATFSPSTLPRYMPLQVDIYVAAQLDKQQASFWHGWHTFGVGHSLHDCLGYSSLRQSRSGLGTFTGVYLLRCMTKIKILTIPSFKAAAIVVEFLKSWCSQKDYRRSCFMSCCAYLSFHLFLATSWTEQPNKVMNYLKLCLGQSEVFYPPQNIRYKKFWCRKLCSSMGTFEIFSR